MRRWEMPGRGRWLRGAALALFTTVTACDDGGVTGASAPTVSSFAVVWETPHEADGAARLLIEGPGLAGVSAASDDVMVLGFTRNGAIDVAVIGVLQEGALLVVSLDGSYAAADYTVRIIEVADKEDELRPDLSGYRAVLK